MASNPKTERSAIEEIMETLPPVREITEQEFWDEFDYIARRRLGISGKEFLERWNAGEWQGDVDQPGVITLAMRLPAFSEQFLQNVRDEQ